MAGGECLYPDGIVTSLMCKLFNHEMLSFLKITKQAVWRYKKHLLYFSNSMGPCMMKYNG